MYPTAKLLIKAFAAASTLALASCVASGSKYTASKAAPPKAASFVVQPLEAKNYAGLSTNDKGVRDFEKIYLALRLVDELQGRSGVGSANLSTTYTPSADFTISGNIVESNGFDLNLAISMIRVDGAKVFSKTYAIQHKDAREANVKSTLNGLFRDIASDLIRTAGTTTISLPEARTKAYAENNSIAITPDLVGDAGEAGDIERSAILKPITQPMLLRIPAMTPSYVSWQSISAPLVRDQVASKKQKGWANAASGLSLLAGATALSSQLDAARTGNTLLAQNSQQLMQRATITMIQSSAIAEVAENKIKQIEKTLSAYKAQFSIGQQRTITVRVFGKLRTLTGSQAEILQQFRQGVKNDLNSRAKPAA